MSPIRIVSRSEPAVQEPTVQFDIFSGVASRPEAVERAIEALATAPTEARGAVHTRPELARFILDLAGYRTTENLLEMRLLEPSCGAGVFVLEAARRLLEVWDASERRDPAVLADRLRAVEIHRDTCASTRRALRKLLTLKLSPARADAVLDAWLVCDDFLLAQLDGRFDVVVGNPPYVRQESIPSALLQQYRADYRTIYDRADLYIPFFERGLTLLSPEGRLSYVCADRWTKNRFGGPLRAMVVRDFALRHVVKLHGADVFEDEVDAYPSVFTIERSRDPSGEVAVATSPAVDAASLCTLAGALLSGSETESVRLVSRGPGGDAPWVFEASDALCLLRRIEREHPTLQEAGCSVGIGVATGADRVFIGPAADLPIEPDRILPLATARDVREDGTVEWSGAALANPFEADGTLVDLTAYPRLRAYFDLHSEKIRGRHVAKKTPDRWYRTIDKVRPGLRHEPKLLIPDIKGGAVVAYDDGRLYPHHNLYYVVSAEWDLRAVQTVLRSRLAEFQVAAYAVRMRGGYLRFQAQYLRRIRLPLWETLGAMQRRALTEAALQDRETCDRVVGDVFGLSFEDWATIRTTLAR